MSGFTCVVCTEPVPTLHDYRRRDGDIVCLDCLDCLDDADDADDGKDDDG